MTLAGAPDAAQPCGFAGPFASPGALLPERRGRRRTARRASASAPPSSRSTTQTAVCTTSPAARSASTESSSAPPDVTTSSIEAHRLALLERPLQPVSRSRTPSPPCARSGTGGPTRATPRPRARPRRARARRAASRRAHARGRRRRSARRAAGAGPAASRTGTCPGSSASGCPERRTKSPSRYAASTSAERELVLGHWPDRARARRARSAGARPPRASRRRT